MLMCLSGIYQFLCLAGNATQPADHKLRIYLSLMLHSNILYFTWRFVLVNHQYEDFASKTYTILEFGLIINATTTRGPWATSLTWENSSNQ